MAKICGGRSKISRPVVIQIQDDWQSVSPKIKCPPHRLLTLVLVDIIRSVDVERSVGINCYAHFADVRVKLASVESVSPIRIIVVISLGWTNESKWQKLNSHGVLVCWLISCSYSFLKVCQSFTFGFSWPESNMQTKMTGITWFETWGESNWLSMQRWIKIADKVINQANKANRMASHHF